LVGTRGSLYKVVDDYRRIHGRKAFKSKTVFLDIYVCQPLAIKRWNVVSREEGISDATCDGELSSDQKEKRD
jgi:hypothetical protein